MCDCGSQNCKSSFQSLLASYVQLRRLGAVVVLYFFYFDTPIFDSHTCILLHQSCSDVSLDIVHISTNFNENHI